MVLEKCDLGSFGADFSSKLDIYSTNHAVLDTTQEIKRGNWSTKQKRAYWVFLSGLKKAEYLGDDVRFLTLTTADDVDSRLIDDWNIFKKRVRRLRIGYFLDGRYMPMRTEYQTYMVWNRDKTEKSPRRVPELGFFDAYGVQCSDGDLYIDYDKSIDFISAKVMTSEGNGVIHALVRGDYIPKTWIEEQWRDIHDSSNVRLRLVRNDVKTARYVVSQYVSGHGSCFLRCSYDKEWICKGAKTQFRYFQSIAVSQSDAIDMWDNWLYRNSRRLEGLDKQERLDVYV